MPDMSWAALFFVGLVVILAMQIFILFKMNKLHKEAMRNLLLVAQAQNLIVQAQAIALTARFGEGSVSIQPGALH